MKNLYARFVLWLLGPALERRAAWWEASRKTPDAVPDRITALDPATGDVTWSISKDGLFISFNARRP